MFEDYMYVYHWAVWCVKKMFDRTEKKNFFFASTGNFQFCFRIAAACCFADCRLVDAAAGCCF